MVNPLDQQEMNAEVEEKISTPDLQVAETMEIFDGSNWWAFVDGPEPVTAKVLVSRLSAKFFPMLPDGTDFEKPTNDVYGMGVIDEDIHYMRVTGNGTGGIFLTTFLVGSTLSQIETSSPLWSEDAEPFNVTEWNGVYIRGNAIIAIGKLYKRAFVVDHFEDVSSIAWARYDIDLGVWSYGQVDGHPGIFEVGFFYGFESSPQLRCYGLNGGQLSLFSVSVDDPATVCGDIKTGYGTNVIATGVKGKPAIAYSQERGTVVVIYHQGTKSVQADFHHPGTKSDIATLNDMTQRGAGILQTAYGEYYMTYGMTEKRTGTSSWDPPSDIKILSVCPYSDIYARMFYYSAGKVYTARINLNAKDVDQVQPFEIMDRPPSGFQLVHISGGRELYINNNDINCELWTVNQTTGAVIWRWQDWLEVSPVAPQGRFIYTDPDNGKCVFYCGSFTILDVDLATLMAQSTEGTPPGDPYPWSPGIPAPIITYLKGLEQKSAGADIVYTRTIHSDKVKDSTGNGNHGTLHGTSLIDSEIGQGRGFSSSNYIYINDTPGLRLNDFTIETALYLDDVSASLCGGITKGEIYSAADGYDYSLRFHAGNIQTAASNGSTHSNTPKHIGANNKEIFTASGAKNNNLLQAYFSGIPGDSLTLSFINTKTSSKPLIIGSRETGQYGIQGGVYELRVSSTPRSAAWQKATSHSLKNTLLTIGEEQPSTKNGWSYCRTISINHGVIDAPLSNFPVRLILNSANFDFLKSAVYGQDVRLTTDEAGANNLSFERLRHDQTAEKAEYEIKIPAVSDSESTQFYLHYGNLTQATDAEDAVNVWDSNFVAVYHMGEYQELETAITDLPPGDPFGVCVRGSSNEYYMPFIVPRLEGGDYHLDGNIKIFDNAFSLQGDHTVQSMFSWDAPSGYPEPYRLGTFFFPQISSRTHHAMDYKNIESYLGRSLVFRDLSGFWENQTGDLSYFVNDDRLDEWGEGGTIPYTLSSDLYTRPRASQYRPFGANDGYYRLWAIGDHGDLFLRMAKVSNAGGWHAVTRVVTTGWGTEAENSCLCINPETDKTYGFCIRRWTGRLEWVETAAKMGRLQEGRAVQVSGGPVTVSQPLDIDEGVLDFYANYQRLFVELEESGIKSLRGMGSSSVYEYRDFMPYPFAREGIKLELGSITQSCKVTMPDDQARTARTMAASGVDFRGKRCILRRLFPEVPLDSEGSSSLLLDGYIQSWISKPTEGMIIFTVSHTKMDVRASFPRRNMTLHCGHRFRGKRCGYSGTEERCDHSIMTCEEYGNRIRFADFQWVAASQRRVLWK